MLTRLKLLRLQREMMETRENKMLEIREKKKKKKMVDSREKKMVVMREKKFISASKVKTSKATIKMEKNQETKKDILVIIPKH